MVGAAPDGSQKVTKSTWKQFENCTISQIRLVENGTEIKCKETLNYSHAGPQMKGGYLFNGAPVNLVNSLSQHVQVVGMEDADGALTEQHYGVVVSILASKKRYGVSKRTRNKFVDTMGKTRGWQAIRAENWYPAAACSKRQGKAVVQNVHFSNCGQRGTERGCLNFKAGTGSSYDVRQNSGKERA